TTNSNASTIRPQCRLRRGLFAFGGAGGLGGCCWGGTRGGCCWGGTRGGLRGGGGGGAGRRCGVGGFGGHGDGGRFGSRLITCDGSRRALGSGPGGGGRLSFTQRIYDSQLKWPAANA